MKSRTKVALAIVAAFGLGGAIGLHARAAVSEIDRDRGELPQVLRSECFRQVVVGQHSSQESGQQGAFVALVAYVIADAPQSLDE